MDLTTVVLGCGFIQYFHDCRSCVALYYRFSSVLVVSPCRCRCYCHRLCCCCCCCCIGNVAVVAAVAVFGCSRFREACCRLRCLAVAPQLGVSALRICRICRRWLDSCLQITTFCKILLAEQQTLLVKQSHYTLLESRERYFPCLMLK